MLVLRMLILATFRMLWDEKEIELVGWLFIGGGMEVERYACGTVYSCTAASEFEDGSWRGVRFKLKCLAGCRSSQEIEIYSYR